MKKEGFCKEVIDQFSEFIFWNYNQIEVFDTGPEYGVKFSSSKNNREIIFTTWGWGGSDDNFFIDFKRKDPAFFRLLKDTDPRIYFSVNLLFKDNPEYKKISKVLNEENYPRIIAENISFLKRNLLDIMNEKKWLNP